MNYIIFDLEWNQGVNRGEKRDKKMPLEIVEIGAVKLNEDREMISEFSELIKPQIYHEMHNITRKIIHIQMEELEKGKPFEEVMPAFLEWCGEDYGFCTWGASDLYYLQSNMDFYYMDKLDFPLKFYNIQQIYADIYDEEGRISKLEKACSELGIPEDEPFHAAINDAKYTAKVMAKIHPEDLDERYTFDIYRHPKRKEDEIIAKHAGILERISAEYPSKQDAMNDKDLLVIRCAKCGRKCFKKVKWFQNGSNASMAVGRCVYHGYMNSKIKYKSAGDSDSNIFVVKKTERTGRKGYEEMKRRQIELREKRKQKRHREKKSKEKKS